MTDYTTKTYGRNTEVEAIYKLFQNDRDVSMPGPRRLGKTFVLERIVERGPANRWHAVKAEIAGCTDARGVFKRLCEVITKQLPPYRQFYSWSGQRIGQVVSPRFDPSGPWYQGLLGQDYETWFERIIRALNNDKSQRWAVLIDELPIFLKALHDRGPEGVAQALSFMNLFSRLRDDNRRVRWLITGSIGIAPLARAGKYMGVMAKFDTFELEPLTELQAKDYIQDLARTGSLSGRSRITDAETDAILTAVGWRAAYYLDALSQKMAGQPSDDPTEAAMHVEQASERLLAPVHSAYFGTWEEHIRKHYLDPDRGFAFCALAALAAARQELSIDTILSTISRPDLTRELLHEILTRLHTEGFVTVQDWDGSDPTVAFRNPLLRSWWQRYKPQANG